MEKYGLIFVSLLILGSGTISQVQLPHGIQSSEFSAAVSLSGTNVSVGSPVYFSADFVNSFSDIQSVCFHFQFDQDLLDPGDGLSMFSDELPQGLGGFSNPSNLPQQERTFCLVKEFHSELISAFLDGRLDGGIIMGGGSVRIQSLRIIITGVALATVDIKPGGDPNSINVKSQGVIPVAILTTPGIDAARIDLSTVRFGRTGEEATPVLPVSMEDVNLDGDLDIVLRFKIQDAGIQAGDTHAALTGVTFDLKSFQGSDAIRAFSR